MHLLDYISICLVIFLFSLIFFKFLLVGRNLLYLKQVVSELCNGREILNHIVNIGFFMGINRSEFGRLNLGTRGFRPIAELVRFIIYAGILRISLVFSFVRLDNCCKF